MNCMWWWWFDFLSRFTIQINSFLFLIIEWWGVGKPIYEQNGLLLFVCVYVTLQCDETRETEQDGKSHKEGKILLAYTITRQQNENDRLRFRYRRLQTTFSITKILTTRYKRTKNKT